MDRRNTIQKDLVLSAVTKIHRHVTADEVYEFISADHPTVSKGTVYRNLNILADENRIRRVGIPDGPDCFDFTLKKHYHVKCVCCGNVCDVDMDAEDDLKSKIKDAHGIKFLDYDILFRGICSECQQKKEAL